MNKFLSFSNATGGILLNEHTLYTRSIMPSLVKGHLVYYRENEGSSKWLLGTYDGPNIITVLVMKKVCFMFNDYTKRLYNKYFAGERATKGRWSD